MRSGAAGALHSGKVVEKAVRGGCSEVDCGPEGLPRPIWRPVRRCAGREMEGGRGAGESCRGGKGAGRKPSVEGDVREGVEG